MEKLQVGILGCGGIAARFARALAKSQEAELAACAARDKARAEAFAGEHGAARAYGSYEELVNDPAVQVVYIATVHTGHAQAARLCIEAGKAVLCEKPFFVSGREAEEIIALAREKNVLVMEAFWTRLMPAFQKAKEWIREGKIGQVKLIRGAFCFPMPVNEHTVHHRLLDPALGGGALLDVGVYPYEYVTGLMDGPPDRMHTAVQLGHTGVDATVAMTMEYDCGVLADCMASIAGWMDDTGIISGTEGFIKQYYFPGCRKTELYRGFELAETYEDPEEEGFVHEIAHFAKLYREGKTESDVIPLQDTLDFARRIEGILGKEQKPLPTRFTLEELAQHEERLTFEHFGTVQALELGEILRRLTEADGLPVAVQIELGGMEVYRRMPEGTTVVNDRWLEKKRSTVRLMGKSTLRLWTELAAWGFQRPPEMLPTGELVYCGGGFPLRLKDGTLVGAAAVSAPNGDNAYEHEILVRALEELGR